MCWSGRRLVDCRVSTPVSVKSLDNDLLVFRTEYMLLDLVPGGRWFCFRKKLLAKVLIGVPEL